jgi:predicted nucleotidyltransferase
MSETLSHLPSKSRELALDFTQALKDAFGSDLLAVMIYGSAAGGEYIEGKSDINIMIVLKTVTAAELENVAKAAKPFARKGLAVPLVFDKNHIATSLDTFPIEFSDMRHRHILLHGADPLEGCKIETRNLRFQCERELKSILVNLRRGFLQSAGKKENIQSLLESSLSSVIAACRGLVFLNGATPSNEIEGLLGEVQAIYKIDTAAIIEVWHFKKGKSNGKSELMKLFDDYCGEIALLAATADKL